ncbi:MAG: SpoIIE family protein phosphatase [Planctomycetes bacterium]|nr:SpoIIE family protein phosphatase [Planctomycetota bacterium]
MGLFFGRGKKSQREEEPVEEVADAATESNAGLDDSTLLLGTEDTRESHRLTLLLESIAEVTSTIDHDRLLVNIVDKSIQTTQAERGLLLLKGENGELEVRVARTSEKKDLPADSRYSTHVVNQVSSTRRPVRTMVRSDAEALDLSRSVYDLKLRAVMCTALTVGDDLLGVLLVDSRAATREFSRSDLAFFDALSRQIAIAITNARLVLDSLEKTRLEQSLRIAGQIQRGLLPTKAPAIRGYDLHGWCEPAEEASGDTYDFIALEDGRWALVIGDVSGHGIGPALLTSTARASLRSYLRVCQDLSSVITWLNQDLCAASSDEHFMTMFAAIFDPPSGRIDFVNAGHPAPLLMRADGRVEELAATGFMLGVIDSATYETGVPVMLEPGDLLFCLTDGIPESHVSSEELFGMERVKNVLRQCAGKSAKVALEAVVQAVRSTAEKVDDDLTAVALHRARSGG